MQSQESSVVSVYGKPGCVQCKYTARMFEDKDVPTRYVDVSVDETAKAELETLGYTTVPVVVTPAGDRWSGFSPDRIKKAIKQIQEGG